MIYLLLILVFLTIYIAVIAIHNHIFRERLIILHRLEQIARLEARRKHVDERLDRPFIDRVARPFLMQIARVVSKLTPMRTRAALRQKLMSAGTPGNLTVNEFLATRYTLVGLALICLIAGTVLLRWQFSRGLLWGMVVVGAAWAMPDLFLRQHISRRRDQIRRGLPDTLDLLTVSVEAGLGFDAALQKVTEKTKGVLADEFEHFLQEVKIGKPRREALKDTAERIAVDEFTSFVGAVVQADQLGVSIGNVLRVQSDQMRLKRRQRAEEKAMKAPIKMLIPLLLFIFPTIFIVLLGPAVIQVIQAFR